MRRMWAGVLLQLQSPETLGAARAESQRVHMQAVRRVVHGQEGVRTARSEAQGGIDQRYLR